MSIPLSKVRRIGDTVYLAGELGFAEDGSLPEGIAAQTDQTLRNIARTLAGEGLTLDDVVAATVHLADRSDFAAFNEVYKSYFTPPYPVRTTVGSDLMDILVEIDFVAHKSA